MQTNFILLCAEKNAIHLDFFCFQIEIGMDYIFLPLPTHAGKK